MFCSKCGKEIQDGAAFCSSCGQAVQGTDGGSLNDSRPQIIYVNQIKNSAAQCPADEKQKKLTATVFYIISALISVFFLFCTLGTKLELLSYLVDTDYSRNSIAGAFKNLYENHGAIFWFAAIFYLIAPIVQGIVLFTMHKNRNFSLRTKNVVTQNITDCFLWLFLPIIVNILLSNNSVINGNSSFLFWIIAIIIAGFKIAYAVTFYQAAECEQNNIYREKHFSTLSQVEENGSYWICLNCRSFNSKNDMFCQKCGKNKGEGASSAEGKWICKKCHTANDKQSQFCKNCGEYR